MIFKNVAIYTQLLLHIPTMQLDNGVSPYLFAGHDPGIFNNGWAWFDPKHDKVLFQIHDIHTWNGYRHELKAPYDYNERMIQFVSHPNMRELFLKTSHLGV